MSLCSYIYIYIYNKAGSHPGLPGSAGFRVDSPGLTGPISRLFFA
jgi:hypothetical protein